MENRKVYAVKRTRGEQSNYFAAMATMCDQRGFLNLADSYRFFAKFPEEYGPEHAPALGRGKA